MNILLTGGAGYIGSHTIIELDKAGHSVVVVDNLVNSNPESLRRVAKIIGKEIPFYEVDVRDKEALYECTNCAVHAEDAKKVVLQGLDGYIFSEKNGQILLCKRSEEQRIRDFSE